MFAATLPATRLAVIGFNQFFLTTARAALAGSTGFAVIIVTKETITSALALA
jgi:hypothetical protein